MSVEPSGQPEPQDEKKDGGQAGAIDGLDGVVEAGGLIDGAVSGIGNLIGSIGSAAGQVASALGDAVTGMLPDGATAADSAGEAAGSILDGLGGLDF